MRSTDVGARRRTPPTPQLRDDDRQERAREQREPEDHEPGDPEHAEQHRQPFVAVAVAVVGRRVGVRVEVVDRGAVRGRGQRRLRPGHDGGLVGLRSGIVLGGGFGSTGDPGAVVVLHLDPRLPVVASESSDPASRHPGVSGCCM